MFDAATVELAAQVLAACRVKGWRLATAESCTGGLIAAALTAIPGSSDVVDRAFVTYSNKSKMDLLGVPAGTLATTGAVSAETAELMAMGAVSRAGVDLAASATGIAGPGGASAEKPLGLVYLGIATKTGVRSERHLFAGDRDAVRHAALTRALELLKEAAS